MSTQRWQQQQSLSTVTPTHTRPHHEDGCSTQHRDRIPQTGMCSGTPPTPSHAPIRRFACKNRKFKNEKCQTETASKLLQAARVAHKCASYTHVVSPWPSLRDDQRVLVRSQRHMKAKVAGQDKKNFFPQVHFAICQFEIDVIKKYICSVSQQHACVLHANSG